MTTKKTTVLMMFCAALALAPALRAGEGSVSVSPAVVMLRGATGQSTNQTLSFTNGTRHVLEFEMKALDGVVRNGTRVFVEPGTISGSIAATVAFSPREFKVGPGQTFDIKVIVTIPPQPSVRAIAVMCQGATKLGTGPVKMTASIGTLLTFALVGDSAGAQASKLAIEAPTASTSFSAAQRLTNSGTEPIVATGMLAIINESGALAGKQSIPSTRLLPGEKTDMRVEYAGDLPSGRYRAMVTYDFADKTLTSSAEFSVR